MSTAARAVARLPAGVWITLAVVCIVAGLFACALLIPELLIPNDASERLKRENEVRVALIQGFALIGLLLTAGVGFRNIQVTKQGQISERYTNAVVLLGDDEKLPSRFGGVFALEQIARASSDHHLAVMELLAGFTRIRAQKIDEGDRVRPDVQAALTVIGRRNTSNDPPKYRLHLNGIKAPQVRLRDAKLANARLRDSRLEKALFDDADLTGAHFTRAHLEKAHLERGTLRGTVFTDAWLSGTRFEGAKLMGADFRGARVSGARFEDADLTGADFRGARVGGARFDGADLTGAKFTGARVDGARFRDAHVDDETLRGAIGKGVIWVDGSSRDFPEPPRGR